MSTTEPEPAPADPSPPDEPTEWPEPQPDPEEELGETENGLLPSLARIRSLDRETLTTLRDLVASWEGPLVTRFRERVAERLADR